MGGNRLVLRRDLGFVRLECTVARMGADLLVTLCGGVAHLGCCVLASPRPSLTGCGAPSATASVLNVTGHMDDAVCRPLACALAAAAGCTVVCTGGVHVDNISAPQIAAIQEAVATFAREISDALS